MYSTFYKLKGKPFRISSDPSFMWLGEKHREALSTLKYGIFDNKGFMLLTGDVGTGKTTLINALIRSLSDNVYYASVPDPRLSLNDFLNYIAQAYHIDHEFESKGSFLLHFGWFLEIADKQKKKVLLIIDESQLLTQDLLEEIRLLSNINRDGNHLLNVILVGQNEFNDILRRPENRAVTQRITLNYNLEALSLEETEFYIKYRLKISGGTRMLFTKEAVREIHAYSGGIPRRINVICDHCLLTGFVEGKQTIDTNTVLSCIKDVEIPQPVSPPETQPPPEAAKTSRQEKALRLPPLVTPLLTTAAILLVALLALYFVMPRQFFAQDQTNNDAAKNRLTTTGQNNTEAVIPVQMVQSQPFQQQQESESFALAEAEELPQEHKQPIDSTNDPSPLVDGAAQAENGLAESEPASAAPEIADISTTPEKLAMPPQSAIVSEIQREEAAATTLPALPGKTIIVRFENDSYDFYEPDFNYLTKLGQSVQSHPDAILHISGYSDSMGQEAYNNRLSLFRANMVKGYLLGKGVNPEQLKVEGRGSRNAIGDNNTSEGRRLNRRVEINVIMPNEGESVVKN